MGWRSTNAGGCPCWKHLGRLRAVQKKEAADFGSAAFISDSKVYHEVHLLVSKLFRFISFSIWMDAGRYSRKEVAQLLFSALSPGKLVTPSCAVRYALHPGGFCF
jgi:hypothetical protein